MTIVVPPSSLEQQCTVLTAQVVVHIFCCKRHIAIINHLLIIRQSINPSIDQKINQAISQSLR